MSTSYAALCDDFYVNMRLASQLPLPTARDSAVHFFEQLQKRFPSLTRFRRTDAGELTLEEDRGQDSYRWASIDGKKLSSGCVNPDTVEEAMSLHQTLLDFAPYQLGISPVEIDYLDILFGFDLDFAGNHDAIIVEGLHRESPFSAFLEETGGKPIDCQPSITLALSDDCRLQARIDVVTRTSSYQVRTGDFPEESISVYLIMRRYLGDRPKVSLGELALELADRADRLASEHVVPRVVQPMRSTIASRS